MIVQTYENDRIKLYSDEGKTLTNGVATGYIVWLGSNDSIDSWSEVSTIEPQENAKLERLEEKLNEYSNIIDALLGVK